MKKLLFFCFVFLSFTQINLAQCVNPQNPQPTGPSIQTFCAFENELETRVSRLAITSGSNIKWYSEAVGGVVYNNLQPLKTGVYYADDTSNSSCSTSRLKVEVTISGNIPQSPVRIEFCAIENPTISRILVNVPNGVILEWYDSQTFGNKLAPTTLLETGKTYWSQQVEGVCVSKRVPTEVILLDPKAPIVANPTQTYCAIDKFTLSKLAVEPNTVGNSILWFETKTSTVPLDPEQLLVNGASYWASEVMPSSRCESTSRARVDVVIHSTPKPTTKDNTYSRSFCEILSATVENLQADIVGTNIKLYDSNTSTTPLGLKEPLVTGKYYFATQTDLLTGCESLERTEILVTINVTPAPTANATTQTFCKASDAFVSKLVVDGTGIKWYDSLTSTTVLNPTTQLVDGRDYYATQTNSTTGCESLKRTKVSVIYKVTAAPTTSSSTQTFCNATQAFVSNLAIVGTGVKWYDSLTSTTAINPTTQLVDGKDYYATQTSSTTGCESVERTKVSVIFKVTAAPTTNAAIQTFCKPSEAIVSNLVIIGTNIKWYDSLTSTVALDPTAQLVDGKDYYATQSSSATGCESVERTKVSVVYKVTSAPTTSSSTQTFCNTTQTYISNLIIVGTGVKWYDSPTSTTALNPTTLLVDGKDYYATQTSNITGCESIDRTKISVVFGSISAPTTSNSIQSFCLSDAPTLANLEVVGTNIKWYETLTSTTPLNGTTALVDGKIYFATQTNSTGCESVSRLTKTVSLTQVAKPVLAINSEKFCILNGTITLSDLNDKVAVSQGNTISWYDSYPNGTILSLNELLVHNTTYYAVSQNVDGCKSVDALTVTVNLEDCEDNDLIIYDGFSPNSDGINDVFSLTNIALLYPDYEINFYNRWGNIVYTGNAKKPFWNGQLNGNGEFSPKGIYYYIIDFKKNNKKPKQGRLYLSI